MNIWRAFEKNMIPERTSMDYWKVLMYLEKQTQTCDIVSSPDKKLASSVGSPIFCRGFFEVW